MKKLVIALMMLLSPALAFGEIPLIKLTKSNTLSLNGEVTQESVGKLMVEARRMDQALPSVNDPIYLVLNTPGGDVVAGIALADFLNGLHRPIETIIIFAASMGFQIAQQLKARHITAHGTLMSHHARGGVEGEFGGHRPSQADKRLEYWTQVVKELDEETVKRTKGKQTLVSYTDAYDHELWLSGISAVEQGYADDIVHAYCDSSIVGTSKRSASMSGFSVTYEVDKCPMNTGLLNVGVSIATNKGVMSDTEFLAKGGSFSPECLVESATNPDKLCSMSTALSFEKISEIKNVFSKSLGLVNSTSL